MARSVESRTPGGAPEDDQRKALYVADTTDINSEDLAPAVSRSVIKRLTHQFWRILVTIRRDPRWIFGLVLVAMMIAAIFAPLIAPHDPLLYHPRSVAQPPNPTYPMGTDSAGRDVLSRVIYGARISLAVGLVSVLLGGAIGALLGMLAGYAGGLMDRTISVFTHVLLAFPALILALALAATLGASLGGVVLTVPFGFTTLRFPVNTVNLIIALAVVRIPVYIRLARAQTLQVRSLDYMMAARSLGAGTASLLRRHILPNIQAALLVQVTISISFAILDESVLSFLGLGAPPPTPEWGAMISEAEPFLINGDAWMMLGPVLALVLSVLSLNLFGDALRDKLDPRSADRGVRAQ